MKKKPKKTHIMVVDDHTLVRYAVTRLLDRDPQFKIVAEAWDFESCIRAMESCIPDIAIMDITLKRTDGLHLTRLLRQRHPNVRVIMYTMHDDSIYGAKAVQLGAAGYITKDSPPEALLQAIQEVMKNSHGYTDKMADWILGDEDSATAPSPTPIENLSDRERQIFHLIGSGRTTREIATDLGISMKTIETHRGRMKLKLGLKTGNELFMCATKWVNS